MRVHTLAWQLWSRCSIWWPLFLFAVYTNATSLERRASTSPISSSEPTRYILINSKPTEISANVNELYRRDGYLCWAVEDTAEKPPIFCSCSNSQTYPIITQAATSNVALELCGYTAYPAITGTSAGPGGRIHISPTTRIPLASSSSISILDSVPTLTTRLSLPSASASSEIPLWGQCGLAPEEVCAGAAKCICQHQWYSQCRIPISGSWVPPGQIWQCNEPNITTTDTFRSSAFLDSSATQLRSIEVPTSTSTSNAASTHESTRNADEVSFSRSAINPPPKSQSDVANYAALPSTSTSITMRSMPSSSPTSVFTSLPSIPVSYDVQSSRFSSADPGTTTFLNLAPSRTSRLNSSSISTAKPLGGVVLSESSSRSSKSSLLSSILIISHVNHSNLTFPATLSTVPVLSSSSSIPTDSILKGVSTISGTSPVVLQRPPSSSVNLGTSLSLDSSATSSIDAAHTQFLISISLQPSTLSFATPISSSLSTSALSSADISNALPEPSNAFLLPNMACPTSSSISPEACNPNSLMASGNFSSGSNSSSAVSISPSTSIDPDRIDVYLEPNVNPDQRSKCENFAAHQYQVCWEVLNVTGYIQDWVSYNKGQCDKEDMGFADCYTYLEVGAGANCTAFTGRSQCPSPDSRTFVGRTNGAQKYYVLFNIWNIQNWFFTYFLAVQGANGLAADSVNTIVRTLDLPIPKPFPVLELLSVLAFAFGLMSPSGYAEVLPRLGQKVVGFGAQSPGEYLLRAVQNTPTLARNLMATGDLSQSEVQIAQLGSDLARITSQLQTNIQNSLVMVLSNFTLFFDFVRDGFFSTQIEDLNTLTQNVTRSLNTYLVSQALQDNDVIITRALDTDVNQLQLNGSAVNLDTGCGYGYDEWGMCGSWWYDNVNHISYGLNSMKDMHNNYTDALESLFNLGVTTPDLLFLNSQNCADAAGSTQGNAPGTSLSTTIGVWNTECISNMKICSWDLVNLGVTNEYTDCDHESAFAMEGCGAAMELVQVAVPTSYIGPYLTSPLFQGVVCNHWQKGMGSPG